MSRRSERREAKLGRVVIEPVAPPADADAGPDGEAGGRGGRRRWVTPVLLTLLLLVVVGVGYAVTFAPEQLARFRAEQLDGETPVRIGLHSGAQAAGGAGNSEDAGSSGSIGNSGSSAADGVDGDDDGPGALLVPAEGWVVQPLVADLFQWPPLPPLKDWSVLLDQQTGVVVLSPDQRLRIEVDVLHGVSAGASPETAERAARAWLREESRGLDLGTDSDTDSDAEGDAAAPVHEETLASGDALLHADGVREIVAVVRVSSADAASETAPDPEAEAAGADADADAGADADADADAGADAEAAVEGTWITVRAVVRGESIDLYRPALSALLETLGAR